MYEEQIKRFQDNIRMKEDKCKHVQEQRKEYQDFKKQEHKDRSSTINENLTHIKRVQSAYKKLLIGDSEISKSFYN